VLNGEPGADAAAPGVTGFPLAAPQVFVGAPGWPVVGVTSAMAVAPVNVNVATQKATTATPLTSLLIATSLKFDVAPRGASPKFRYSGELLKLQLLAQLADEPDYGIDASVVLID
jgi:hypothetical protein